MQKRTEMFRKCGWQPCAPGVRLGECAIDLYAVVLSLAIKANPPGR